MSEHFIPDKYTQIQCPYDKSHMIDAYRFQRHLIRCAKNHPDMDMANCPFNYTHVIPRVERQHHIANCPDRAVVARDKVYEESQNGEDSEYFHGDVSVPAYHNHWDKAEFKDDWDNEADLYRPRFSLLDSENAVAGAPIAPRHSQVDGQHLRRPRNTPQAASYTEPRQAVGRGRGRPAIASNETEASCAQMNGVTRSAHVSEPAQLVQSLAIGRGIGRGIPVNSRGRGAVQGASANVPNFSPMGRGTLAVSSTLTTNGITNFSKHPSESFPPTPTLPAPGSIGRGREGALSNHGRMSPVGTAPTVRSHHQPQASLMPVAIPRATNVPGFSLQAGRRRANVTNFSLAKPAATDTSAMIKTDVLDSSTSSFLGNRGIGRGVITNKAGPQFVVPNVNKPAAVLPPLGFQCGFNYNNSNSRSSSQEDRDAFEDFESQQASGAYSHYCSPSDVRYGAYEVGYEMPSSTPSMTDSTSSMSPQDFDTEDDEEAKHQKEIRKLQKKLRDIEKLEKKRQQGTLLNADQKEKIAKKVEIEDDLAALRIN